MMEEEDNGAKEEEKENVDKDDVLEDSFESEVSITSIETEDIKKETSYEKRPFEEALSQSDEGTMDVSLDVLFEQQRVVTDQLVTKATEMEAMMTNLMNIMVEREAVRYQEQQEDTLLTTKAGTEDDKWSAESENTSDTEPTDSDEEDQAIMIETIDGGKKGKNEKRINKRIEDRIATICFLDLRASLEDPDNHKEKPLTCDMEPDIQRDQQWKLVYNSRKIKKKIMKKRRPDKPIMHKPVPLSCDLEPDIAEQLKLVYDKRKIKMKEIDKRTLADHIRNTPEPLSCDLEPDIEINKI